MATITEDYCSKEIYRLLIEKGFDGEVHTSFDEEGYTQPSITLQTAMKWLRIKHNIHIESFCPVVDIIDEPVKYNIVISDLRNYCLAFNTPLEDKEFDSYEQACEAAIKYCLENLIY